MQMNVLSRFFLAALALFLFSGCNKVSTVDAVKFNDELVATGKRVSLAGMTFSIAAVKAIEGGVMEVALAKREFENVTDALAKAQSDMKKVKVPDSATARTFFEEHQKLLKLQEQIVNEDFKAIVKVLDDPLITTDVRVRKIRPIAGYLKSIDQDQVGNLKQAQAAFAKEHGFKLKQ
jgi:hypothetical protein